MTETRCWEAAIVRADLALLGPRAPMTRGQDCTSTTVALIARYAGQLNQLCRREAGCRQTTSRSHALSKSVGTEMFQ